jgi:hypothetical protein
MRKNYLIFCIGLLVAAFTGVIAQTSMRLGVNHNYQQPGISAHPEYKVLPKNAPCSDCEELVDRRTEHSRIYLKKGTANQVVMQQSWNPMHYRDKNGFWRTAEATLAFDNTTRQWIANQQHYSNTFSIRNDEVWTEQQLALPNNTTLTKRSERLYITRADFNADVATADYRFLPKASTATGTLTGSTSVVSEHEIELWGNNGHMLSSKLQTRHTSLLGGMKTDYILADRPVLNTADFSDKLLVMEESFVLPAGYRIKSNTVSGKIGSLYILDAAGNPVARIDAPVVFDNLRQFAQPLSDLFEYQVTKAVGNENKWLVRIRISMNWLLAGGRAFPVTIDPRITIVQRYRGRNIGAVYNRSCFNFSNTCEATLPVQIPANFRLTDIQTAVEYSTQFGCALSEAGFRILLDTCAARPYSCTGGGGSTGASVCSDLLTAPLSLWTDFQQCIPTTNCLSSSVINFKLQAAQCGVPTISCTDSIMAVTQWQMIVYGELDTLPVSITGANTLCRLGVSNYALVTDSSFRLNLKWQVNSGGIIVGPDSLTSVNINWVSAGKHQVKCFFRRGNSCPLDSAVLEVTVRSGGLAPGIKGDTVVCINRRIVYTASDTTANTYRWVVSSGGRALTPLNTKSVEIQWDSSGIQNLVLITENSRCIDTFSTRILVYDQKLPQLPPQKLTICPAGSAITLFAPPFQYRYQWNTGDSTPAISVNRAGVYSVVVFNPCGNDTFYYGVSSCGFFKHSDIDSTLNNEALNEVRAVFLIDFNRDGKEDLMGVNLTDNSARILINQGIDPVTGRINFADKTTDLALPRNLQASYFRTDDFNYDGFADCFIIQNRRLLVYRNLSGGQFDNFTDSLDLSNDAFGDTIYSVRLFDLNGDGRPDLIADGDSVETGKTQGKASNYTRAHYAKSSRAGGKTNGTESNICEPVRSYAKAVQLFNLRDSLIPITQYIDYNNDGFIDLFILVYDPRQPLGEHPVRLLANNGIGEFRDVTTSAGLSSIQMTRAGFITVWDYNNDGWLDILGGSAGVANQRNKLLKNNGNGTFTDVSGAVNLKAGDFYYQQALSGDFDNDGDFDLLWITAGKQAPTILFVNQGGTFVNRTDSLGLIKLNVGSLFSTDIDSDGDLDLMMYPKGRSPIFLRNEQDTAQKRFLTVQVIGCQAGRWAKGSRVQIVTGNKRLTQFVGGNSSELTSNLMHFGCGNASVVDSVIVYWLNGGTTRLANVRTNQRLVIRQDPQCRTVKPTADFNIVPVSTTTDSLTIRLESRSQESDSYFWDFGDGNTDTSQSPTHRYNAPGNYTITLITYNNCGADTTTRSYSITSRNKNQAINSLAFKAFPNPTTNELNIVSDIQLTNATVSLLDITGRKCSSHLIGELAAGAIYTLNFEHLPAGVYHLIVEQANRRGVHRIVIK